MTTLIGPLRRAVQIAPDRVAVRCGEVALTYGQVWERTRRLVGALHALGVDAGDRVAVVGRNCHRYLELYQAVPGAGMVLVPLNQRHTAAELAYALEDSGAKVLFAGSGVDYPEGVVERVIDLDEGYESLLADGTPAAFPDRLPDDSVAGLFYTGGTTGAAKGVMLTHRNLTANALHFQASFPFRDDTRWLVAAPLFHAAGSIAVLAIVWHAGGHVVLPAFDPGAALDLIERGWGDGHPPGADDARRAHRGTARPTPGGVDAPVDQPRWRAGRDRDAPPRAQRIPGRRADASLRHDRDLADCDRAVERGAHPRRAPGPFLWSGGSGSRGRRPRSSELDRRARPPPGPSARWRSVATT